MLVSVVQQSKSAICMHMSPYPLPLEPPSHPPYLHFPEDVWCGACFYILICHLYIFFGEVSIKVFSPFLVGLSIFLLFSFKSSLYILVKSFIRYIFCYSGSLWLVFSFPWAYFILIWLIFEYMVLSLCVKFKRYCISFLRLPYRVPQTVGGL